MQCGLVLLEMASLPLCVASECYRGTGTRRKFDTTLQWYNVRLEWHSVQIQCTMYRSNAVVQCTL